MMTDAEEAELSMALAVIQAVFNSLRASKAALEALDDKRMTDLCVDLQADVAEGARCTRWRCGLVIGAGSLKSMQVVALDDAERNVLRSLCAMRMARLEALLSKLKADL